MMLRVIALGAPASKLHTIALPQQNTHNSITKMVLDDASTPDSGFSSTSAPISDMDQFDGDRDPIVLPTRSPSAWPITRPNGLPPLYINFSNLPMPWFPISQTQSDAAAQKQMGETVQKASDDYCRIVGRPFEQTEGDAMVFHLAKALRIASYGPPLGVAASVFAATRPKAWNTYRFPGWTPGEKFNPDKFFMLKGRFARAAWHTLRGNCYFALGLLGGEILMGSYAMTVANVGRLQDPRLKDVNETLKRLGEEKRAQKGLPIEDRTEGKRGQESFEMARQRTRAQRSGTRSQGVVDDMSPTGGSFSQDFSGGGVGGGDEGMLSDSQIQQLQQQEQRNQDRADSTQGPAQNASQPSSSPQLPQPTSNSSGSAWERLRQQAVQPTSQSPQRHQSARGSQPPVNNDDDDAFGLSGGSTNPQGLSPGRHSDSRQQGRDRQPSTSQLSKSDAQREFDAQLERERQGQSFEEKSDGRW